MKRAAGILMPITSLPSPYGVGTLGKSAREFVDFLVLCKQSYWQILPIGPTGYGDSPYASFSSFAGNPYMIDLDELAKQGLLKKEEYQKIVWAHDETHVDYEKLYHNRFTVLRFAVKRLLEKEKKAFQQFQKEEKGWLEDYALYMVIKQLQGGKEVAEWETPYRKRDKKHLQEVKKEYQDEILFYEGIQYLFFMQWHALRSYANQKGIQIIGDLPIYVARDSVEVWANPEVFQLDENGRVTKVAGVPGDGFTPDGQVWGNPLYDWKYLKKTKYAWWIKRIKQQFRFYDVLRLDHFRGFEAYCAIPAGDTTAHNAIWEEGPGLPFIQQIKKEIPKANMIAEDLGFLTDGVREMLKKSKLPGMKVLEFAFDERSPYNAYLPHTYPTNCVAYLGTHDNDTLVGWMKSKSKETIRFAKEYYGIRTNKELMDTMIRSLHLSVADLVMIQIQDYLGLGSEARINAPSTLGGNWLWRMKPNAITKATIKKIKDATVLSGRANQGE